MQLKYNVLLVTPELGAVKIPIIKWSYLDSLEQLTVKP